MLDIVQSFPLLSYCIVSPIYISPICNVEIYYSEKIKIRNSLFFSLHKAHQGVPRKMQSTPPAWQTGLDEERPGKKDQRSRERKFIILSSLESKASTNKGARDSLISKQSSFDREQSTLVSIKS